MALNSLANSDPNLAAFFRLFCEHWQAGTGLAAHNPKAMERDRCWTEVTFSDAMNWANFPNTDPSTIKSWQTGARWPRAARKDAIIKVFFRVAKGEQLDDTTARRREELEQAWKDGSATRGRDVATRGENDEVDGPKRWLPAGRPIATPGLASVRLEEPQPGNEPGSGWFVKARLRFDIAEYEREDGTPIFISVQDSLLTVSTSGYQVATQSVIGQIGGHPNFRPETDNDSVGVVGPAPNGCLEGDPAGGETIARIVPIAEAGSDEAVTVSIHAFRRSFVVSLTRIPQDCVGFDEKQAVLNLLIELGRDRDAQRRVLLARDRMRRTKVE